MACSWSMRVTVGHCSMSDGSLTSFLSRAFYSNATLAYLILFLASRSVAVGQCTMSDATFDNPWRVRGRWESLLDTAACPTGASLLSHQEHFTVIRQMRMSCGSYLGTEQHPDRYNHMQCCCKCLQERWWVATCARYFGQHGTEQHGDGHDHMQCRHW